MKILWHSSLGPTGYGTQTDIWCRYLAAQGHEIIISPRAGMMYTFGQLSDAQIPILPSPPFTGEDIGDALLPFHAAAVKPDVVVVLYDLWHFSLLPHQLPECPVIFWHPVDCEPLDQKERRFLASGRVLPLAMSEFGRKVIEDAGYACEYIPHALDPAMWLARPPDALAKLREGFDLPAGAFVIGINSTSTDAVRKGLYEQINAFGQFIRKHPKYPAYMMIHSLPRFALGADITAIANAEGIPLERMRFAPAYEYLMGMIPHAAMLAWYQCCDVVSNCGYGEGFGLAAIEAQAAGTPVILSRGSTGPQLVGPGWLVDTQPWWNPTHAARWHAPRIPAILKAYEQAYLDAKNRRRDAWKFAAQYTTGVVGPAWEKVLEAAVGG